MNRRLLACILGFFALCAGSTSAQTVGEDPLTPLECVEPDLLSYWKPVPDGEVIIAYSLEGFYADLKNRLPHEVFQSMMDASREAMTSNPPITSAVGDGEFVPVFYGNLAKKLSALAKLPANSCRLQVGHLQHVLDTRYVVRVTAGRPGSWLEEAGVSDLSGKNSELVALIANAGRLDSTACSVVYEAPKAVVRVCK